MRAAFRIAEYRMSGVRFVASDDRNDRYPGEGMSLSQACMQINPNPVRPEFIVPCLVNSSIEIDFFY